MRRSKVIETISIAKLAIFSTKVNSSRIANCCFCLSVGRMSVTMIAARDINARNFLDDTGRSLLSIHHSPAVLSPFCVLASYCYLVIISFPILINLRTEMEATFGDCKPDITVHLRDHGKSVNTAAGFVIAEGGPNKCEDDDANSTYVRMTGILNDLSSISIGVSPVATVCRIESSLYIASMTSVIPSSLRFSGCQWFPTRLLLQN